MIRLNEEESQDKRYRAFRVAALPPYLPPGLVPHKFDKIGGFTVIFFLKEEISSHQKENTENALVKMGVFSEKAYMITSNYPEWVVILDNCEESLYLIKDAWYKPLDELISLAVEK